MLVRKELFIMPQMLILIVNKGKRAMVYTILMPPMLTTMVTKGKRVMVYTMPGPQANRGTLAGRPLSMTTSVNAEKRTMEMEGREVP
jgi:hypothetical protein